MKPNHNKNDIKPMSLMSLLLSFLSLCVISGLLFFKPEPEVRSLLIGLDTIICCLFLLQLTTDLVRAKNRRQFMKEHWVDFIASIPLASALRYGRIFQILRIIRVVRSGKHLFSQIKNSRKEATLASILLLLVVLLTLGSSAILIAEQGAENANIEHTSDALWWAIATVSTVGYGDLYPTTDTGRIIASMVLVCGVGIFGMISGLITSLITTPKSKSPDRQLERNNQLLEKLIREQGVLVRKIEKLEKNSNTKK